MSAAASVPANSRLAGLAPAAIQHVVAAARALELGRVDDAERAITGLLAAHPQHPEVQRLLAGAQSLRGQYEDAAATMRRALAARPDDPLYLNTLGSVLTEAGDYDEAAGALRRACELDPRLATAWLNLGIALMRAMQPAASAEALRRAVALAPDRVDAQCLLADQLKAAGRVDEAIAEYRRVLARRPTAGMAWWGLADIKTVRLGESDVERLRHAVHAPDAGADDRSAMYFALAKAFEDIARFPDALHALARAHAIARERQHWDAAAHAAFVDGVLAACARAAADDGDSFGSEAIFVVGLPRSGSSLVEQVLASHSQVNGAGELPDLPRVLTEESRRRSQPLQLWAARSSREDWRRLGERYLQRTARWRTQRPRSTDKLPYNWLYVGAVRAMLPGARIVVCRRDPLENCLACYRQRLTGNEYTRTFADLAAFWRDFDRAVRQWRALHPGHVHELVHEQLLATPEAGIRALLAQCGLPFEAACLDFHRTERDVHTPSAAQVRQPLRRDTARAPAYGSLLDPLRAALGLAPFVDAEKGKD
jgi:tetratricopeptide (TPR) repeat protein